MMQGLGMASAGLAEQLSVKCGYPQKRAFEWALENLSHFHRFHSLADSNHLHVINLSQNRMRGRLMLQLVEVLVYVVVAQRISQAQAF